MSKFPTGPRSSLDHYENEANKLNFKRLGATGVSLFPDFFKHIGSKDDKQLSFHDFHETFEFCEIFNKKRPFYLICTYFSTTVIVL